MSRPAKITINLNALRHNYQLACSLAPASQTLAVVKANAYGHGATACAKALEPFAPAFAVACIEEALELRDSGISKPILLLEGPFTNDEVALADQHNFWLMLSNQQQIDFIAAAKPKAPLTIWLKIDTGMHRLGLPPHEVEQAYQRLMAMDHVHSTVVVASHFAAADDLDKNFTKTQIDHFKSILPSADVPTSLANSAGILAWPESHGSWNRPGFMLYGTSPLSTPHRNTETLEPVMRLESKVIGTHWVEKDETVGYGCTWQAKQKSLIATVAIGYGDGYPRQAPNGTPVFINNQQAPLAGRVSMDMITIDVTHIPQTAIGDTVELWGENIDVNVIAKACHTIGYELVTRMTQRVEKTYQD
jgi:alanine racemase